MNPAIERLRGIKTLPQLIAYLRDELDWPIQSDDTENVTFDYEASELGLDEKSAVRIKEIKQLRPLSGHQPWGIFFVNFEKKALPVMVMRRILRSLVFRKRTSAGKSERQAWHASDLLFVSAYGEADDRAITFAHFVEDEDLGGLAELRVLGWDDDDTPLKYDYVAHTLHEKLRWRDEYERKPDEWRNHWRSAFELRHREVITTSRQLASQLADLAKKIRARVRSVLRYEDGFGQIRKLHNAFKKSLIHDLRDDDFADMYAQTITYGLFSAAVSRPAGIHDQNIVDIVPPTNPFLRDMLETFLNVGGRKGKINFDELGIQEVVALLNSPSTHLNAVLRDFGNRTQGEDPVIHFYQDFLQEYDSERRVKRGVFYTPQPVVSYIVRSVHELLQTDFKLEDGLADTTTWCEMAKKHTDLKIPEGVKPDQPFVQILDPATGTATFLVEVIEVIHRHLKTKWDKTGLKAMPALPTTSFPRLASTFAEYWNQYVALALLPRLHGYELMMAPYAIAHMKIGLKLFESGYRFGSDERARIYLTNSLEPPQDFSDRLVFDAPALAHEAAAVNKIKRLKRFTVIIGNPPYSRVSQNQSEFIQKLLKDYKEPVADEANQQPLDDDYIKFLRLAHHLQTTTKCGIIGFITNHTVLSGILFRGVRERFLEDQDFVAVLDLHGNANIKEKCADGSKDENVFDILAGVAITIGVKAPWLGPNKCVFHELWGLREIKYTGLAKLSVAQVRQHLTPVPPYYFLKPIDLSAGDELKGAFSLPEIFPSYSSGLMTVRDNLAIAFDRSELRERYEMFRSPKVSDTQFQEICPVKDYRRWSMAAARRNVRADKKWEERIEVVNYRPFDKRWIFYSPDIITYPNFRVMDQFKQRNLGLISSRIHKGEEHAHEFATREMVEIIFLSSKSSNNAFLFPLYSFDAAGDLALDGGGSPNFSQEFLKQLSERLGLRQESDTKLPQGLTPEDIFHHAYAVLHSPGYRSRYAVLLKFEFPRLPLTGNLDLFRALTRLGAELVALHLLESPKLDKPRTEFIGGRNREVQKITWAKNAVWIDKAQTTGFKGVPENVWNFHIGGYQVCEKWLKDRKGRTLSKADMAHYQKIVIALAETIRLMAEIDKVIEKHGGWPGAFITNAAATPDTK